MQKRLLGLVVEVTSHNLEIDLATWQASGAIAVMLTPEVPDGVTIRFDRAGWMEGARIAPRTQNKAPLSDDRPQNGAGA